MLKQLAMPFVIAGLAVSAHAGDTVVWTAELSSSGEDIMFVTNTAVRTDTVAYDVVLEVTELIVTVEIGGFPSPIDVTDFLPPDVLLNVDCVAGPAPVESQPATFQIPDEGEPAASAEFQRGIDENGFGFFTATNVFLGDIVLDFGTFPILEVELSGTVTVDPRGVATCPGDITQDGMVNIDDLLAVIGEFGDCECCGSDIDVDDEVTIDDLLTVLAFWGPCS